MARDAIDISLIGGKEMQVALERLSATIQKKVVRQAMVRATRPIVKSIRSRVPGSGEQHSLLKRGIKAKMGRRSRHRIARFVTMPTRQQLGIPADSKFYWPAALEYGHVTKGGGFVAARSFFRSGFDAVEKKAIEIFKKAIGDGIAKEWKRG